MRHYDLQAAIYNVQYLGEQDAKIDDILKSIDFESNDVVLDLGCGTGFLFRHINKQVGLLVGVDLSRKALQEAKERTKNLSNVVLVRADADNMPFPDRTFDKIFAITLLQNMPNALRTVSEMKRAAKPQAIFAVTGLKQKFTQESFLDLLEKAQLKIVTLGMNQQLKGYVAVCTNS